MSADPRVVARSSGQPHPDPASLQVQLHTTQHLGDHGREISRPVVADLLTTIGELLDKTRLDSRDGEHLTIRVLLAPGVRNTPDPWADPLTGA